MIDYLRRLIFFVALRGTIAAISKTASGHFLFTILDLLVVIGVLVAKAASAAQSTKAVGIAESSNVSDGKAQ
jgi:hypothetical protein